MATARNLKIDLVFNSELDKILKTDVAVDAIESSAVEAAGGMEKLEGAAAKAGKSMADRLSGVSDKMKGFGKKMSLAITAPIVGLATAGTKMAMDLDTGIRKVRTLADAGVLPVDKIQSEVRAISDASGIAQTEIAEAAYSALSAGVDSAKVMEFVRSGIDLTRAGFTSMETAIDATTTVLNAYGDNAYEVSKIHDIFVQTQDKGKISVDQLGSSIGRVIPTASSLGVNLDQLGAGYAILTAKGQNAQLATTNLNAMFGELGKTGSATDVALRDISGKSFAELTAEGKTTGEVLGLLDEYAKKNNLTLKDLFGSMNAGSAAVTLLSGGVDGFNAMLDEMNNATGKTSENAAMMEDGWYKIEKATTQVKNAMIDAGAIIAPYVEMAAEKVSGLVEWFSKLDEGTKLNIMKVMGLAAAIGLLLVGFAWILSIVPRVVKGYQLLSSIQLKSLIPAIWGSVKAAWSFTAALLANPITWVVIGIVALIGAIYLLWKNWDTVSAWMGEKWDWVKEKVGSVFDWFGELPGKMLGIGKDIIGGLISGITGKAKELFSSVTNTAKGIRDKFKSFFGISSPSKLMMEYGLNIQHGLQEGMESAPVEIMTPVLPDIAVPSVTNIMPALEMPAVFVETFLPAINAPAVTNVMPDIAVSLMPDIAVPSVTNIIPKQDIPAITNIMPDIVMPKIETPAVTNIMPGLDMPEIMMPALGIPAAPEFNLSVPEKDLPSPNTSTVITRHNNKTFAPKIEVIVHGSGGDNKKVAQNIKRELKSLFSELANDFFADVSLKVGV